MTWPPAAEGKKAALERAAEAIGGTADLLHLEYPQPSCVSLLCKLMYAPRGCQLLVRAGMMTLIFGQFRAFKFYDKEG
jgi:hypothetical protein